MNEGIYALVLAILAPTLLLPEEAIKAYAAGKISKQRKNRTQEIVLLREDGWTWQEISEMFGCSKNSAQSAVSHWKARAKQ